MRIDPPRPSARPLFLLATLCVPLGAALAGELQPYASLQTEYNSNIFALESREQALAQNGSAQRSDQVFRYIAGAEGKLPVSQQVLRAKAEVRHLQFANFNQLDHDEYLASAGWDWRVSSAFSGQLEAGQERRLASFEDRDSTALTLETERKARLAANVAITPRWRLETGLKHRDLDSPLPDFPEFKLQEDTVSGAVKYQVVDQLAAGVYVEHQQGRFDGVPDTGRFDQQSVAVTADYTVKDFSSVGAAIGVTRRDAGSDDGEQALTGELSYRRNLTGKTKLNLQLFRRLRSYVGGASSVTEDGASVGLKWQATEKTSADLLYRRAQGRFEDAGASFDNAGRNDKSEQVSLTVNFQALPWLAIRPYGTYQSRRSNLPLDSFEAGVAGLELRLTLP